MNPPLVSIQSDILSQSHWEDKGVRSASVAQPFCATVSQLVA